MTAHSKPLRVCYFGTYRDEYARNSNLIEGLRRNGVDVVICHVPLWGSFSDRVDAVEGNWRKPQFWLRIAGVYGRLLRKYWAMQDEYDVLVTGYPGQFDVFLARLLSWINGKPLAWDILMSIYLITVERGLAAKNPIIANLLHAIEYCAVRLPDILFLDSSEYVRWFADTYHVSTDRFRVLPTGADSDRFRPATTLSEPEAVSVTEDELHIVYHGTFLATHGVDTIIEAARLLRDHTDIRFTLLGTGPEHDAAAKLADSHGLTNVEFTGWVDESTLQATLAEADIVMGAVGVTPQSFLSVQNKIYEGLAMAKPVITGDGPAVRQFFEHGVHLYLCQRADPTALAVAIVRLQMDTRLRRQMAELGHRLFRQRYTIEGLGALYAQYLSDLTH